MKGLYLPQFAARAVIDLTKLAKMIESKAPHDEAPHIAMLAGLRSLLLSAKHFVLPDNAAIYRHNEVGGEMPSPSECQSFIGLPAAVCAFEYNWTQNITEREATKVAQSGRVPDNGPRRITIALDRTAMFEDCGLPCTDPGRYIDILSIAYSATYKFWMPQQFALVVPVPLRVTPPIPPANGWGLECGMRDLVTHQYASKATVMDALGEMYSDVTAIVQVMHALRAGAKLRSHTEQSRNRRRFFESNNAGGLVYHTLVLPNAQADDDRAAFDEDAAGTHASPRHHFRRAHIRTLPSGDLTWVRSCYVGREGSGEVLKIYNVTPLGATGTVH